MEKGQNFPFKLIGPLGQEMDQPPCFGNISSFLLLSAPWGWRQWAGGPWGEPADQELPRCLLSLAEKEKNGNCIKILLIWSYMNEFDAWLEVARLNVLLITLKGWSVIQKSMYLPCLYNLSCLQRRWAGTMLFSWRGSTYLPGSQSFLIKVWYDQSKVVTISQKLVLISKKLFWSVKSCFNQSGWRRRQQWDGLSVRHV